MHSLGVVANISSKKSLQLASTSLCTVYSFPSHANVTSVNLDWKIKKYKYYFNGKKPLIFFFNSQTIFKYN